MDKNKTQLYRSFLGTCITVGTIGNLFDAIGSVIGSVLGSLLRRR